MCTRLSTPSWARRRTVRLLTPRRKATSLGASRPGKSVGGTADAGRMWPMTDDHSRATAEDENAAALPPLRLGHSELHAPTFRTLDGDDGLYDLAAWAFHYAQKLPLSMRAPFMAGLWRAWPRARGPRRGVRGDDRGSGIPYQAQQAH